MTVVNESRDVSYSPDRMFALVADIESYPRFLPEYAAVRVERRDANTMRVRQILRLPGRRLDFTTVARLTPPESIDVSGVEGPFRKLSINWTFQPLDRGHCRILYRMEFEIGSRLLSLLADRTMAVLARRTLTAFERRARELHS